MLAVQSHRVQNIVCLLLASFGFYGWCIEVPVPDDRDFHID